MQTRLLTFTTVVKIANIALSGSSRTGVTKLALRTCPFPPPQKKTVLLMFQSPPWQHERGWDSEWFFGLVTKSAVFPRHLRPSISKFNSIWIARTSKREPQVRNWVFLLHVINVFLQKFNYLILVFSPLMLQFPSSQSAEDQPVKHQLENNEVN